MIKNKIPSFILLMLLLVTASVATARSDHVKELQMKAAQGDTQAGFEVGKRFEEGKGVEQDLGIALTYYSRSEFADEVNIRNEANNRIKVLRERYYDIKKKAESGDPKSEYDFGTILSVDLDYVRIYSPGNEPKAIDWLKRAAEHGYRPAQKRLARAYLGVIRLGITRLSNDINVEESLFWYSKWALSGSVSDQVEFANILGNYQFARLENSSELRKKLLTQAAQNGSAEGMLLLGYFIRDNENNDKAAFEWFIKSANKGYSRGQFTVGLTLFFEGNLTEAVKWLELAAANGSSDAQQQLGDIYENSVPPNHQLAFLWYKKAAMNGHAGAAYQIGRYFHEGIAVPKDVIAAWAWYSLGIDRYRYSHISDDSYSIEEELSLSDLKKSKEEYEQLGASGNRSSIEKELSLADLKKAKEKYEQLKASVVWHSD